MNNLTEQLPSKTKNSLTNFLAPFYEVNNHSSWEVNGPFFLHLTQNDIKQKQKTTLLNTKIQYNSKTLKTTGSIVSELVL